MSAIINDRDVLSMRLSVLRVNAWRIEAEVNGDAVLSGAVTIDIDGVRWSGTVKRSGGFGGSARAVIVGGKGGLTKVLEGRHYSATNVATVATDICREAGETLAPGLGLAAHTLPHWERVRGQASHCLLALCDRLGLTWRVLRDGTIWIGSDTWASVTPKVEVDDEDWESGSFTLMADSFAELAKLYPGLTYDGNRIEQVVHHFSPDAIRTVVRTDSVELALDNYLEGIRRRIDMAHSFPCRVQGQNADGTLQLVPIDSRLAKPGNGLDNVKIRVGLPGFRVSVTQGAVVTVSFEGGDPDKPYVGMWDQGNASTVTSLEFEPGGINSPFIRVGDELEVTFPMGLPITTSLGTAVIAINTPAKAIATGPGNGRLRG